MPTPEPATCRFWKGGLCATFKTAVYCPLARAAACLAKGECVHDPLHEPLAQLMEMRAAKFNYSRFQGSSGWLERAYVAFKRSRSV